MDKRPLYSKRKLIISQAMAKEAFQEIKANLK